MRSFMILDIEGVLRIGSRFTRRRVTPVPHHHDADTHCSVAISLPIPAPATVARVVYTSTMVTIPNVLTNKTVLSGYVIPRYFGCTVCDRTIVPVNLRMRMGCRFPSSRDGGFTSFPNFCYARLTTFFLLWADWHNPQ